MLFGMLLGGLWFGYWIRDPPAAGGRVLANFFVLNVRWN
ncbi:hypothetical protein NCGM1179_0430 [Pseudomonas aeruginosa NCMG1179]|nr:hypothetical protein NCGM1179_0430 [Pseudomonas aeruginosa NCMG1179]